MKLLIALFVICLYSQAIYARVKNKSECLGETDAKHFAVYLHGMDSEIPSQQELANRDTLNKLVSKHSLRIAVVRAKLHCPTQITSLCWGWNWGKEELQNARQMIMDNRSSCFAKNKPFGLIGFSNGGYFLTHWYLEGVEHKEILYMIAVGANKGHVKNKKDLSLNPPLVMLTGKEDSHNNDNEDNFFMELKDVNAKVVSLKFNGGHEMDEKSLNYALKSLLK